MVVRKGKIRRRVPVDQGTGPMHRTAPDNKELSGSKCHTLSEKAYPKVFGLSN